MGRSRPARAVRVPARFKDEEIESDPHKILYCVCRQPFRKGEFMIACDAKIKSPECWDWCHGKCVGISYEEAQSIGEYLCRPCGGHYSSPKEVEATSAEDPGQLVPPHSSPPLPKRIRKRAEGETMMEDPLADLRLLEDMDPLWDQETDELQASGLFGGAGMGMDFESDAHPAHPFTWPIPTQPADASDSVPAVHLAPAGKSGASPHVPKASAPRSSGRAKMSVKRKAGEVAGEGGAGGDGTPGGDHLGADRGTNRIRTGGGGSGSPKPESELESGSDTVEVGTNEKAAGSDPRSRTRANRSTGGGSGKHTESDPDRAPKEGSGKKPRLAVATRGASLDAKTAKSTGSLSNKEGFDDMTPRSRRGGDKSQTQSQMQSQSQRQSQSQSQRLSQPKKPAPPPQQACVRLGCHKKVRQGHFYCSVDCERSAEQAGLAKRRAPFANTNTAGLAASPPPNSKPLSPRTTVTQSDIAQRVVPNTAPPLSLMTKTQTLGSGNSAVIAPLLAVGTGRRKEMKKEDMAMRLKLRESLAAALMIVSGDVKKEGMVPEVNEGVKSVKKDYPDSAPEGAYTVSPSVTSKGADMEFPPTPKEGTGPVDTHPIQGLVTSDTPVVTITNPQMTPSGERHGTQEALATLPSAPTPINASPTPGKLELAAVEVFEGMGGGASGVNSDSVQAPIQETGGMVGEEGVVNVKEEGVAEAGDGEAKGASEWRSSGSSVGPQGDSGTAVHVHVTALDGGEVEGDLGGELGSGFVVVKGEAGEGGTEGGGGEGEGVGEKEGEAEKVGEGGGRLMSAQEEGEKRKKASEVGGQIESELYDAFGGVGKKYREKARSLLFNLKDVSNPDLRRRVMEGEISAEELCQMSADQLASRELSEWRAAKMEEADQQRVLPADEAWHIVKKTHKGEVEIDVGFGRGRRTDKEAEEAKRKADEGAREGGGRDGKDGGGVAAGGGVSEGGGTGEGGRKQEGNGEGGERDGAGGGEEGTVNTAVGQGSAEGALLLEGEGKVLAPLLSMDEFMDRMEAPRIEEGKGGSDSGQQEEDLGFTYSPTYSPTADEEGEEEGEEVGGGNEEGVVWSGKLRLGVQKAVEVVMHYRSGERLPVGDSMKALVEVKGRVRLTEMDRFFKDLRKSTRSRAVMVSHAASATWTKRVDRSVVAQVVTVVPAGGPGAERNKAPLEDASELYFRTQRVGMAEPSSTLELYLLPITAFDFFKKHGHDYTLPPSPPHAPHPSGLEGMGVGEAPVLLGAIIRRRFLLPYPIPPPPQLLAFREGADPSPTYAGGDGSTAPMRGGGRGAVATPKSIGKKDPRIAGGGWEGGRGDAELAAARDAEALKAMALSRTSTLPAASRVPAEDDDLPEFHFESHSSFQPPPYPSQPHPPPEDDLPLMHPGGGLYPPIQRPPPPQIRTFQNQNDGYPREPPPPRLPAEIRGGYPPTPRPPPMNQNQYRPEGGLLPPPILGPLPGWAAGGLPRHAEGGGNPPLPPAYAVRRQGGFPDQGGRSAVADYERLGGGGGTLERDARRGGVGGRREGEVGRSDHRERGHGGGREGRDGREGREGRKRKEGKEGKEGKVGRNSRRRRR